jgi:cell division protein FtsA
MEKEKIIVGLDIGTTKTCAIVGRQNEYGKLEVLGMGKSVSEGVVRGIVTNIEKTINSIESAISETEAQSGINIKVVNVGIAGQHIRSTVQHGGITREPTDDEINIEDINRLTNDMYKIVTPPGSEIIHVMPQDYYVDYEDDIKDPVGMTGVRLEADFHIITAQTTAINNVNKCVRRAGLEIDNLILEPLASSLSVLSEEEKEAGVCLVDIGGGTTDVAVFHEGIIRHTAVIPFGGNILTNDIKQGCNVLGAQAELLKIKFGKAIAEEASPNEIVSIPGLKNRPPKEISIKNLANIIEARMQEIIELVHTEIITSGFEQKLSGGIILTGGGAQLACLKQLVEYMTGMDARIGYPNEHLGKSKVDAVKSPMFATTIGLVLSGFRAIDERENRYNKAHGQDGANVRYRGRDRKGAGMDIFARIIEKTKGLLIDDVDEKQDY